MHEMICLSSVQNVVKQTRKLSQKATLISRKKERDRDLSRVTQTKKLTPVERTRFDFRAWQSWRRSQDDYFRDCLCDERPAATRVAYRHPVPAARHTSPSRHFSLPRAYVMGHWGRALWNESQSERPALSVQIERACTEPEATSRKRTVEGGGGHHNNAVSKVY